MLQNNANNENHNLKIYLSKCVNAYCKTFKEKELIITNATIKKQICFITYGKASIIKTDINGKTTILKELKANDIFSNLFFKYSEDDIYILSNKETEVYFIDYYTLLKNCNINCSFHNNLVLKLYELLIEDNRQQNEKIELLSKRSVEEKILFFINKRKNNENIFKITTSLTAIAEYLCVDRSNFMRELKKLEEKKIIKKEGKYITLLK